LLAGEHTISQSSDKASVSLKLSVVRVQQQAEQQRRLADKTTAMTSLIAAKQQQLPPNGEMDTIDDTTDAQFLSIGWKDVLLRRNVRDWRALQSYHDLISRHRGMFEVTGDDPENDDGVYLPMGIKLGGSGGSGGAAATNKRENFAEFSIEEGYAERNSYTYERLNEKQKLIYNAIMHMNESYKPKKDNGGGGCEQDTAAVTATDAQNASNNDDYDPSYMGDVVLIQAPPGTGKTHVMLTVAHQLMGSGDNLPHVIIFKNGLVFRYRYCAAGFSVAKFCMYAFGLRSLETFKGLERVVNRLDSVECIINNVLQLTRQFTPSDNTRNTLFEVRGNVLMFDEYTVITKIILLALLFAGKQHNLKYVFCGDRNQLGCIRSSAHTHNTSSYEIIESFTSNIFDLDTYIRCGDNDYNSKISLIGSMASDEMLGDRGNAIVAALFLPNMLRSIDRYDTIIMRNHRALSNTVYIEALKHETRNRANYAYSFWILEKRQNWVHGQHIRHNSYMPNPVYRYLSALKAAEELRNNPNNASEEQHAAVQQALRRDVPGKHLPFLVLNVGGIYYYETMSDSSLCVLREIRFNQRTGEPEGITVDLVDENLQPRNVSKLLFRYTACNDVVFSQHFNYLTNDGCDEKPGSGTLINFPIYPKFIMTTYMSQGCTISTRVSFNTVDCNYKCLYVMMSRVRSPDSINSVSVPNPFSHLISVLMNFDVTRYDNMLPVSEIEAKLLNGVYIMYRYWNEDMGEAHALYGIIQQILDTRRSREDRSSALSWLRDKIARSQIPRTKIFPMTGTVASRGNINHNPILYHNTMTFMLRYKIVMMGLVQLTQYEATIWLRAFLQRLEISSQFSHKLFSTRHEYSTTSLHFEHLFESDSNYKLLAGINIEPMSWQNDGGQHSSTKTSKAPLPSQVAVLFGQHVRRINMAYWRRHSSIIEKNTNTDDDDANDEDYAENLVEGISLNSLGTDSYDDSTTCKQQNNVLITPCSNTARDQASDLLKNSDKVFPTATDASTSSRSTAKDQQQQKSSMKKPFRFMLPKLKSSSSSSSSKAAENGKRKSNNGNEKKEVPGVKRRKDEEYLEAKDAFSRCKTLTELLVARLNL